MNEIETVGKEGKTAQARASVFAEVKNTRSHVSHITVQTQIRIPLFFFFPFGNHRDVPTWRTGVRNNLLQQIRTTVSL